MRHPALISGPQPLGPGSWPLSLKSNRYIRLPWKLLKYNTGFPVKSKRRI